eukprot:COSAG04_NODE_5138_length_1723_cov_1.774631_2_plen_184_part_00
MQPAADPGARERAGLVRPTPPTRIRVRSCIVRMLERYRTVPLLTFRWRSGSTAVMADGGGRAAFAQAKRSHDGLQDALRTLLGGDLTQINVNPMGALMTETNIDLLSLANSRIACEIVGADASSAAKSSGLDSLRFKVTLKIKDQKSKNWVIRECEKYWSMRGLSIFWCARPHHNRMSRAFTC